MPRYLLASLLLVALASSCTSDEPQGSESLQGIWKSDAEKTLHSMRSTKNIDPSVREMFEDDFFGHLHVEYQGNNVRYWLDNEDYDTGFREYELIEETGNRVTIREGSGVLTEPFEDTLTLDGNCFWVITEVYNFKEYFCRAQGDI